MDGKILFKEKVLDIIGGLIDFHLILLIIMRNYRGIKDILKGYAFDGIEYSFLKVEKTI
jgi:hypothetical protein